jgi:hypothetical protein
LQQPPINQQIIWGRSLSQPKESEKPPFSEVRSERKYQQVRHKEGIKLPVDAAVREGLENYYESVEQKRGPGKGGLGSEERKTRNIMPHNIIDINQDIKASMTTYGFDRQ